MTDDKAASLRQRPSPVLEHTPCNLCGADDAELILSKPGAMTGLSFQLRHCPRCDLFFLSPRLSRQDLLALYDEAYYCGEGFDSAINYVKEYESEHSKSDVAYHLERLRRLVPAPARVLDAGCGTGLLLRAFERAGYEAEGIEPSNFASSYARTKGHNVRTGDFLDADYPDDYFDAVVSIEVLEHVADPLGFVRNVHRVLKPGGMFYYTTGNFRYFRLERKLFGRAVMDSYVTPEGHIVFFTNKSMRLMLQQAGFKDVFTPFDGLRRRECIRFNALLRRTGLLKADASPRTLTPLFRLLYFLIVAMVDPVLRPALPLGRK